MKLETVAAGAALALVLTGGAQATPASYTLYDTLGGAENGGDPLAAAPTGAGPILNDWIKTGPAATLTSATFNLKLAGDATGSFDVFVAKIDSLAPSGISQLATLGTISDLTLTTNFALYTVTPAFNYTFDPNSFYVVGLSDSNNSNAIWGNTVDPIVLARPSVIAGEDYFNNGGVQANAGGPYELAVNVANVPEPAAWALMLVGVGGVGASLRARRKLAMAAA